MRMVTTSAQPSVVPRNKLIDRATTAATIVMTMVAVWAVFNRVRETARPLGDGASSQISKGDPDEWSGGRIVLGNPDAPVTLVVFSDLFCPFCRSFAAAYGHSLKATQGSLRVEFRHLPLSVLHPEARVWAAAASCAHRAGRFTEFHDLAFGLQDSLSLLTTWQVAKRAGLTDSSSFQSCVTSDSIAAEVTADSLTASKLRVTATPTFIVGDRWMSGSISRARLDSLIAISLSR